MAIRDTFKSAVALIVAAAFAAAMPAYAAEDTNTLVLLDNAPETNALTLDISGAFNALSIAQQHDGGGTGNLIQVGLDGDHNGGWGESWQTPRLSDIGLVPGRLEQRGFGNVMQLAVQGTANLFALGQIGSSNFATGSIIGTGNEVAVLQSGYGNSAVFNQVGHGNVIGISQTSW